MNGKSVINVKIENIIPNRFQPRLKFNEEELNELANSIKTYGVIEPMILRQVGDKYEIIAGERRYKATQLAGIKEIPAIIMNLDDKTSAELALVENIQRKELSPLEEAMSYKKLLDLGQTTQEQLAIRLGKSQSSIANKLRLLNLPKEVQDALLANLISERHARSILQLKESNKQVEVLNKIIKERMTVRDTDEYIKSIVGQNPTVEGPIMNIENNSINDTINLNELAKEQNNNSVQSALNEIDIIDGNSSVFNDTEPVIEEKKEKNEMNQTNNQNRFFPSLEDQAVNMNFNQPTINPVENMVPQQTVMPQEQSITAPADVQNSIPTIQPIQQIENSMPTDSISPVNPISEPISVPPVAVEQNNIGGFNGYMVEQPAPTYEQQYQATNITPISVPPMNNPIEQPVVEPAVNSAPVVEMPVAETIVEQPTELNPVIDVPQYTSTPIMEPVNPMPTEQTMPISPAPTETVVMDNPVMPEKPSVSTVDVNKAIYDVKETVEKLRSEGFEVTLNELDLGNEYQLVVRIKE